MGELLYFPEKRRVQENKASDHECGVYCPYCGYELESPEYLIGSDFYNDNDIAVIECELCEERFWTKLHAKRIRIIADYKFSTFKITEVIQ